jgi:hypothetical protein
MARERKVFMQPKSGSICILGHRFLKERGLHLALAAGDIQEILHFAKEEALRQHLPQVTIMYPPHNSKLEEELHKAGFTPEPYDCIVLNLYR